MKKLAGFVALAAILSACAPAVVTHQSRNSDPPEHRTQATGSQSAKAYAPPDQKKGN